MTAPAAFVLGMLTGFGFGAMFTWLLFYVWWVNDKTLTDDEEC